MEVVVRTPGMLPQTSITILLPDGYRRWWNKATHCFFVSFIEANKQIAQLVPRRLCVFAAATVLWMTSSHIQLRIWLTILGRNRMIMVWHSTQIEEPSRWRNQASKSLNRCFRKGLSGSSDTLKWSETMLLVSWPITSKALLLEKDVGWLCEYDYIVNPPAAGPLPNRMCTNSRPAAHCWLWWWNAQAGRLFKDPWCGWVFFWHFGGWTDGW